ncbi:hypothetical protein F5X99DRAFT_256809 [Biscogniauxia marginata]|nr:hypothetical protein F5X99DRAFT_256809 [Biscogniauxia marginata]
MRNLPSFLSALSALFVALALCCDRNSGGGHSIAPRSDGSETYLNLTAITGRGRVSVLECWRLSAPFATSDVPGISGTQALQLGDLANATYTVLPARFDGGLHNAPAKQYVWFISGLIHLTLPNATGEAWVYGGKYGLIYADDTADISGWGHITRYPGNDETVALAIPVKDGVNPKHTVLHDGPCVTAELAGV